MAAKGIEFTGRELARLAEDRGLAIALADSEGHEISAVNNNSICATINPAGEYSPACAEYCGKAYDKAFTAGKPATYECHAGLQCVAIPFQRPERPLVVIVGRTFLKAENYKRATDRAISGDWAHHVPADLFANSMLTSAREVLTRTAAEIVANIAPAHTTTASEAAPADRKVSAGTSSSKKIEDSAKGRSAPPDPPVSERSSHQHPAAVPEPTTEAGAWRSFLGSLTRVDYGQATQAVLEFIALEFGFDSLVWLDRVEDGFETLTTFGNVRNRRIRMALSPNDDRVTEALRADLPVVIAERASPRAGASRMLYLFPLRVDTEVTGAVAVINGTPDEDKQRILARFCRAMAPQLEILRLRREVARRDTVGRAVRRIGESVRNIDSDDFWLSATQTAAELLNVERASLLVHDPESDTLVIKAIIGSEPDINEQAVGERVARTIFDRAQPVIIPDITRTDLVPDHARGYRTESFMSCPIMLGPRVIGVMNFTDRVGGQSFDRRCLDLFHAIAPQLAIAIDRGVLKERAGQFEQLSVTDPLTGLLNRRYVDARLAEEIKRSNRHGFPMSYMMLDIDHFKSYNDSFGHPAGDEALKIVGHVVRETLRGADVLARVGGEEFAIMLPQTTGPEALTIAERIRQNIENTAFPHRPVTCSIGVASCSAELCVSRDLVEAADRALYQAKRQGRNRVVAFEQLAAHAG
jgi:diguanylate cyclase (GGDEF)-like protein